MMMYLQKRKRWVQIVTGVGTNISGRNVLGIDCAELIANELAGK